jgi:hypothetical protein
MVCLGFGRHVSYAAREYGQPAMREQLELGFAAQIIYNYAIGFVKLSIGMALLRINTSIYGVHRKIIFGMMGFVCLYTVVFTGTLRRSLGSGYQSSIVDFVVIGLIAVQCQPVVRTIGDIVAGSCYATHVSRTTSIIDSGTRPI